MSKKLRVDDEKSVVDARDLSPGRKAGVEGLPPGGKPDGAHTSDERRVARKQWWLLSFFIVLGLGLRMIFLFGTMGHDEAETFVLFASRSLRVGLSNYPFPNNHIFHTLLVHESTSLFGNAPWAIRLPALLAGILVVPATFFAVRGFFGRKPALLAAGLAAVSWPLVSYSVNARGYTIQTLIFLLLLIVAQRIKRKNDLASWAGFVCLGALGFFTVPTMMYFFGAVAIWLLISALRGDTPALPSKLVLRLALSCVAVAILVLLLYTPALIHSGITSQVTKPVTYHLHGVSFYRQIPIRMIGAVAFFTLSVMLSINRSGLLWVLMMTATATLTVFLAYGFVVSVFRNRRLSKHRSNLALVLLVWSAVVVLAQGYFPPERVFIPFIPLYFGYASAGLYFTWSRIRSKYTLPARVRVAYGLAVGLTLILAAVLILAQVPWQPRDLCTMRDAPEMAAQLSRILRPGDVVYMEPVTRKNLEYYFIRNGLPLSYFYGTDKYGPRDRAVTGRSFIVVDDLDGSPLDKTVKWAHLPASTGDRMDLVVCCDNSAAFIIPGRGSPVTVEGSPGVNN